MTMAMKPTATPGQKATRFNSTAQAILWSLVISAIGATVVAGNPFRAVRLAYLDYSHTPAAGAAKASTTKAPATQDQAEEKKK